VLACAQLSLHGRPPGIPTDGHAATLEEAKAQFQKSGRLGPILKNEISRRWHREGASMRHILQLSILFSALCASAAFGTERVRLAQTQTIPPPPPVQLLPQISPSATCALNCDTIAMTCSNACVSSGTTTDASAQCNLTCTSQQLVCKQAAVLACGQRPAWPKLEEVPGVSGSGQTEVRRIG
jgi:hypothetical protein